MFSKIKGKLKDVFKKHDEALEEDLDDEIKEDVQEESLIEKEETLISNDEVENKSGFFKNIFKKRDSEDLKDVEDEVLDGFDVGERDAIKSEDGVPSKIVDEAREELEKDIEEEEVREKEVLEDIEIKNSSASNNDLEGENLVDENKVPESENEGNDVDIDDSEKSDKKDGFFSRTFSSIKKKKISEDDFDKIWLDLEIFLLEINVAFEIVERIGDRLKENLIGNSFSRFSLFNEIRNVMVSEVSEVLKDREANFLDLLNSKKDSSPIKIMMLGVNGSGKTTSIGKLIKFLEKNNFSVVVAAADTFRAAAVEQIDKHCENLGVKCIKHNNGSDPAAVAFDAIEHAKAKGIDVVLIDTAGRMPNNSNLMMELSKIKKVSNADFAIFVGDSIAGNDLIDQISLFDKIVSVDGVILTKVDTDERPGSIVTCAYSIDKPIFFLGIGQGYDDLIEFNSKLIAEKLFDLED